MYRLLNPVLKRLDKSKQKELEAQIQKHFDPVDVSVFIRKIENTYYQNCDQTNYYPHY